MERKKWTHQLEITQELLRVREKKRWQLALRRYVIEKTPCTDYAVYFGLPITEFRKWIEIQFTADLNWENFGTSWQFEHILPVSYFDFSVGEDLKLCWNFVNIKVAINSLNKSVRPYIDEIAAKAYFMALYDKTGYSFCLKMINKINQIEATNLIAEPTVENFLISNKNDLDQISSLSREEFNHLNGGVSLFDILLERDILKKFG
ncbi:MAG: hypothetical protein ABIS01_05920 [Ferruginibacter sp.]